MLAQMVDLPHSLRAPVAPIAQPATRRPARQALALVMLILPVMITVSWVLAALAGAPRPEGAAALTSMLALGGAAAIVAALSREGAFPHRNLGWCNVVTLLRGGGIAVLAGLVLVPAGALGWALVALATLVALLDALDGWVARRTGMQSRLGARLDVESDVAFALVLAALAVAQGQVGLWFLALGLLRPLFLLAGRIWPVLAAPLPDAAWRRFMAGVQMVVQVALLAPVLAPPVSTLIGAALLGAMMLSFAVDMRWLIRRGARP